MKYNSPAFSRKKMVHRYLDSMINAFPRMRKVSFWTFLFLRNSAESMCTCSPKLKEKDID
jgi:hypothetical protein